MEIDIIYKQSYFEKKPTLHSPFDLDNRFVAGTLDWLIDNGG